jgi:excisionase family DNA binding protein
MPWLRRLPWTSADVPRRTGHQRKDARASKSSERRELGAEKGPGDDGVEWSVHRHVEHGRQQIHNGRMNLTMDTQLLTVDEAGMVLNTGPRFVRRLIAERRIEFVRVGRHVRIPQPALLRFIADGTVRAGDGVSRVVR